MDGVRVGACWQCGINISSKRKIVIPYGLVSVIGQSGSFWHGIIYSSVACLGSSEAVAPSVGRKMSGGSGAWQCGDLGVLVTISV